LNVEAILRSDGILLLRINLADIIYLTKNTPNANFGGYVYAMSVCIDVYDRQKYSIVNIYVSSDSDFNDDYLAGHNLIDLVKVYVTNSNGQHVLDYLKNYSIDEINPWFLFIEAKPTISKQHTFTVKFEKSNGEVVSGVSQKVIWE